jgi:hypothetical protein
MAVVGRLSTCLRSHSVFSTRRIDRRDEIHELEHESFSLTGSRTTVTIIGGRIHHQTARASLIIVLMGITSTLSPAQETTPNPGAWRPLVHADLKTELPDNLTYVDIWKDALAANNRAYDAKGVTRGPGENAPAVDAHVVIRSPQRTVVLTMLDTEAGCKPAPFPKSVSVAVKMCPTRLVIFDGVLSSTKDLPPSCYLEVESGGSTDPSAYAAYAAYDTVTMTIKIGLIIDHQPVDQCARFIPTS